MATRFWVGGTGTWDASDTTHWAASSNGAGGQSVPGSSDSVTFDGSSGGGTVTVNFGGLITIQSLTTGAFTGTLDFSANNNSVTLSANTGFAGSGAGTRTINLGNGTWTLSGTAPWDFTTTTGLTFNANSSTIAFTNTAPSAGRNFTTGGQTYNALTVAAVTNAQGFAINGTSTFASVTFTGTNSVTIQTGVTVTIANLTVNGTAANPVLFVSSSAVAATVAVTSATLSGMAIRAITFTGSPTANNSISLNSNTGITINPPSGGSFGGLLRPGIG